MPTLNEVKRQLVDLKGHIRTSGSQIVTDAFKSFFDSYPEIAEVRWIQYTPDWNDGDVCVFSVGQFCPIPQTVLDDLKNQPYRMEREQQLYEEDCDIIQDMEYRRLNKMMGDLQCIQDLLDDGEDLLELLLGNNIRVLVRRDGLKLSDYSQY